MRQIGVDGVRLLRCHDLSKANTLPGRTGMEDYLKHVNLSDEACFLGPGSCLDDLWDRMFSPCFNDV